MGIGQKITLYFYIFGLFINYSRIYLTFETLRYIQMFMFSFYSAVYYGFYAILFCTSYQEFFLIIIVTRQEVLMKLCVYYFLTRLLSLCDKLNVIYFSSSHFRWYYRNQLLLFFFIASSFHEVYIGKFLHSQVHCQSMYEWKKQNKQNHALSK